MGCCAMKTLSVRLTGSLAVCMLLLSGWGNAAVIGVNVGVFDDSNVQTTTELKDRDGNLIIDLDYGPGSFEAVGVVDFENPSIVQTASYDLGDDGFGSFFASSNLAVGEMKLGIVGDNRLVTGRDGPDGSGFSRQIVQTKIQERIELNPPNTLLGTARVRLTLDLEGTGSIEPGELPADSMGEVSGPNVERNNSAAILALIDGDPLKSFFALAPFGTGPFQETRSVVLEVDVPDGSFLFVQYETSIGLVLENASGELDFTQTATVGVELPDGYTFTSQSGVFLTGIPLPAGFWLFGSALGLLGWLRRKLS